MSRLRKAAMVAYMASVGGILLGSGLYLSRSEFMPYHSEALGMSWQAIPVKWQVLFLALMHSVGAIGVSFGCAVARMLAAPFRRAEA